MQQVQQPLQQEEPRQSPLQKGNQTRKPLSKDEILNCIILTKQEWPKYKPGAPMLSEANVKAIGPNCVKLHAYVMEHSKDKLAFPAKVDQDYFKGGCGALMLNIAFSSTYCRCFRPLDLHGRYPQQGSRWGSPWSETRRYAWGHKTRDLYRFG
jgi:hypothetical protein